jgi:hypothetical protein
MEISREIMKRNKLSYIILPILLILLACSPSTNNQQTEATTGPDLTLTITAQAILLQSVTQTAFASTHMPELTATTVPSSTPEFTATANTSIVTVNTNTNCRTGPGVTYDIVGALIIGQQAEVVGKNSSTGYWIINNPNGPGTCWLWGEYATITGDTTDLQEYAIPPTTTPRADQSPVIDRVEVRFDSSSGGLIAYQDVYFHDSEGDANFVDWQLISVSTNVSETINDVSIPMSANQRNGSVITGKWSCGTKNYQVTLGVAIHDQAGNVSNTVRVTFSCN